jgi:hypothetical protein
MKWKTFARHVKERNYGETCDKGHLHPILKHPRLTSPGNFFYQYVNDLRYLQIFVQILSFPKVYSQICLRQEPEENCCFCTNLFIFAKMFTKSKRGWWFSPKCTKNGIIWMIFAKILSKLNIFATPPNTFNFINWTKFHIFAKMGKWIFVSIRLRSLDMSFTIISAVSFKSVNCITTQIDECYWSEVSFLSFVGNHYRE